jgi:two-component sensor histidine kinase
MTKTLQDATSVRSRLAAAGRRLLRWLMQPRPLRTQLMILTLASALPITAFCGLLLWQLEARERAQYEERLQQTAYNLAGDIDRQLDAMLAMLKTLTTSTALKRGEFAEFHAQSRQAIAGYNYAIILADPTGQQLLNTRVAYGAPLPRIADMETLPKVLASGHHQVSNLFLGNVSLVPQLNIHTPVMRDGVVVYDLVLAFSPDLIRDILVQQFLPPGWIAGVTDGNLKIIARSKDHDRYVYTTLPDELAERRRQSGVFAANRLDGTAVLRTVRQVLHADWVVSTTVERSVIAAATSRASTALLVAGLLLIGAVAAIAALLSKRLTQEISNLARAAGRLDKGLLVTPNEGMVSELNDVIRSLAAAAGRRRKYEQERELLVRELNHRVKNSFAVLQSIMNATLRTTTDPATFAANFKGRLHSMAAAQDILTSREWTSADLEPLVRGQLAAYLGGQNQRLRIMGPEIELPPEAAVPIGLILHELGTNAAKYGALSTAGGRVDLTWAVTGSVAAGDRMLRIEWREQGGPPVSAPERRGFGSTLIERGLPAAEVERRFDRGGVTCTIVLPLDSPHDTSEPAHQDGATPGR